MGVVVRRYIYRYPHNHWQAEASHPCLLNYPNFRYIYLFIYLYVTHPLRERYISAQKLKIELLVSAN